MQGFFLCVIDKFTNYTLKMSKNYKVSSDWHKKSGVRIKYSRALHKGDLEHKVSHTIIYSIIFFSLKTK